MAMLTYLLSLRDNSVSIPIQRNPSILSSFVIGMMGYLIFLGLSTVIIPSLKVFNLSSILDLYSSAAQPFFADNPWFTLISFGLVIAYIESNFFFGKLPEMICDALHIPWDLKHFKFWGVIGSIIFLFVVMHITAKISQTGFNEAMVMVALFALVSMVMVTIFKEILPAIFLHIIANSTSVLDAYKLLPSTYVIFGGVGVALIIVVLAKQMNIRIVRGVA